MGIIVLHSAYVSLLMFLLLDKGPSRAKACLGCKKGDKTFGGHVTAHLYENYVVLFSVICVAVLEFVFDVLEQKVNPVSVCVIKM
jgi:hypothetical protein